MSIRSSRAVRNAKAQPAISQPKVRDLSRGALMLGTALGCSIAVFAAGAPGTAHATSCTTSIVAGLDTVTCTSAGNPYPTGISVTDLANNLTLVLNSGVVVHDEVFAEGKAGGVTTITVSSGDTITTTAGENGIVAWDSGAANINNGATVNAYSRGLWVFTGGPTGDGNITNSGNITVNSTGGYSAAIIAGETGNAYVHNTGTLKAYGANEAAGVYMGGLHNNNLYNKGNITVVATNGTAYGITTPLYIEGGYANFTNIGNLSVVSDNSSAAGINAHTLYTNSVTNTGSIYVVGTHATGIYAKSDYGSATVYNTGNISVFGGADGATGIYVVANQTAKLEEYGSIEVEATGGNVTAAYVHGDPSLYIGGDVTVNAGAGTANGPMVSGVGDGNLTVKGNVSVTGAAGAYGAILDVTGNASLYVEYTTTAHSSAGSALGIGVIAGKDGDANVGTVNVQALGNAYGVEVVAGGNASAEVYGDVSVEAFLGNATGVEVVGGNTSSTHVFGNVTVLSLGYNAAGVEQSSTGDATVEIDGNVSVTSLAGTYAAGVEVVSGGTIDITVDGSTMVQGYIAHGIHATSDGEAITVNVGDVTLIQSTTDPTKAGAAVQTYTSGVTHVTTGLVETYGEFSDGILVGQAGVGGGAAYVDAAGVVTHDAFSTGIDVYSLGNVGVTAGMVETDGFDSAGVDAFSLNGGVTVETGTVTTHGTYSTGIIAEAGGPVVVFSGNTTTFGASATGVYAHNVGTTVTDTVKVYAGNTITHGDYSDGIEARGYNYTYVGSYFVETYGKKAEGIYAYAKKGPVVVNSDEVITFGNIADGIEASSSSGTVTVDSNDVYTHGYGSTGIFAHTSTGDVVVNSGFVHTYYTSATGIAAESTSGNVTVNSSVVLTDGKYSTGIYAHSGSGNVAVYSTIVETGNFASAGIFASSNSGDVYVESIEVLTGGSESPGILAYSHSGNAKVNSDVVETSGNYSTGIEVASYSGNATVFSEVVETEGSYSVGISAVSKTNHAYVNNGDFVETSGYRSAGIYAYGNAGATVISNAVETSGNYSDGIHAISNAGTTSVTSGYVKTTGVASVGIYAYGINGVTVNSGTVKTYSYFADGIDAIAPNGTANVTSHKVLTTNYEAIGINAYGYTGAIVHNTDYVVTEGYKSIGIKAYAFHGDVTVTSDGVGTYGDDARGISAVTYQGNVSVTSNEIFTHGFNSDALVAVIDDGGGDIHISSNYIYTEGDYSQGIHAHAHVAGGNITVSSGTIKTYGYKAIGLYAAADGGATTVTSDYVLTEGDYATGIRATSRTGTKVYSGDVYTDGFYAPGIYARATNGSTLVHTYGDTWVFGDFSPGVVAVSSGSGHTTTVINDGYVYAESGVGVEALAFGGESSVINHGTIFGGEIGVYSRSTTENYILNTGSIAGGGGYAINTVGGYALINNHGDIYGWATLQSSNNVVNNSGRWWAYGNSYFGYGHDTFNNTGSVFVAPFSGSPTTVTWAGLTAFNNSGLVDLRNGHTGDVFNLVGNGGAGTTWTGSGGSTLAVDATLTTGLTSDRMNIGAAAGATAVVVDDLAPGSPGVLNFTGTTVVHGTSGSAGAFTWVGKQKGFVDYELRFFSGSVNWNIVGLPDKAAFEMLKAPTLAQDFWRRSGDAWTAREQEIRDSLWGSAPPTRGSGWEMWGQAQDGGENLNRTETFSVGGFSFSPNLSTESRWSGFQMGADNWNGHNVHWGFTGGFVAQDSRFKVDHNSIDTSGWNAGVYAGVNSGAFFMNALLKGDWYSSKANMITAATGGLNAYSTFSGNTWGAKGELGWRMGSPHFYFEPIADLAWTTTHLDNANFPNQMATFTFSNATSLRGSAGARLGGQWGMTLPYVGLYWVQEFDGKNNMTMITGTCPSACMSIEDLRPGAYGRADIGFTTVSWHGLEGFAKAEDEFGGQTNGLTGRLGVRWRW
jgi:uncharacterized protein YhjY with autotransporter beta-barrel domain